MSRKGSSPAYVKGQKTGVTSNSVRRYSQPVGPSPVERGRRVSEAPSSRTSDALPPGAASLAAQYDSQEKSLRKLRGGKDVGDTSTFDPESYNPDGSLRTVHKMPNFSKAYEAACQARYIRHPQLLEREKELSVQQMFDKTDSTT